jgi:uncharacterized protein (TIGR02246 family)
MKRNGIGGLALGMLMLTAMAASTAVAAKGKAVAASTEEAKAGIDATNRKLEAAIKAGDGAAAAACYTKQGQLLPTGSDIVTGTDAIAAFWQAGIDGGVKGVKLTTLEVESQRGTAQEVGTYEVLDGDGNVIDHGKYVVIWKKRDDVWKLHRDIWNTSVAGAE